MKTLLFFGLFLCICIKAKSQVELVDVRDNKTYKTIQVGQNLWMAQNLNYEMDGAACYKKKAANCEQYGKLYTGSMAQKVCPSGWHLPSKMEVENFMKASTGRTDFFTYSGITKVPLYLFKNLTDLNIKYGGFATLSGKFEGLEKEVNFWTTEKMGEYVYAQYGFDKESFILRASQFTSAHGAYVRCVKD